MIVGLLVDIGETASEASQRDWPQVIRKYLIGLNKEMHARSYGVKVERKRRIEKEGSDYSIIKKFGNFFQTFYEVLQHKFNQNQIWKLFETLYEKQLI